MLPPRKLYPTTPNPPVSDRVSKPKHLPLLLDSYYQNNLSGPCMFPRCVIVWEEKSQIEYTIKSNISMVNKLTDIPHLALLGANSDKGQQNAFSLGHLIFFELSRHSKSIEVHTITYF